MKEYDNLGEPWYPCEGCRALCCRNLFPVLEVLKDLQRQFPGSSDELEFPYPILPSGQCSMLDPQTWKCKNYDSRPLICSTVGMWQFLKGAGLYNGTLMDLRNEGLQVGCGGAHWNRERNERISKLP